MSTVPRCAESPPSRPRKPATPTGTADSPPIPADSDAPAEIVDRPPWPDDADGPRFTFVELIEQEALGYRAWGTPVGDFLARRMEDLSQLVRWTQATTPEEHEDRMEAWDGKIRDQWRAIGYEEGRRAGCHCDDYRR
jgi:hypothetical protein